MAVISKGITLAYGDKGATTFENTLTDLYEIPELGGDTDKIEVTNLEQGAHTYIDGLKNYGDSVAFKFWYESVQFKTLNTMEGIKAWKVTLPDGNGYTFEGTPSVKLDGAGTNAALSYTLNIAPSSEMKPFYKEV